MDSIQQQRRSRVRHGLRTFLLLLVMLLAAAPSRANQQPACKPQLREQDTMWLVSDRVAGCGALQDQVGRLRYWRYDGEQGWTKATLEELLASDSTDAVTTVFVHGNRIDYCEAFTKGWGAYRTMIRCADERPVRFVIWSWPSETIRGPVVDAREKACRTDPSGTRLAWLVDQINPDVPLTFWAHSYGARIVTGALHLLGGGSMGHLELSQRAHATRQPMNAVLIVAALDSNWLMPGHWHGNALSQMAGLMLINNGCDALLKRYHLIYGRRCCQQALGYTGLGNWGFSGDDWSKVRQIDACCYAGRRHTLDNYICNSALLNSMLPYLLFQAGAPEEPVTSEVASATTDEAESTTE